jgi:hypothetical protein
MIVGYGVLSDTPVSHLGFVDFRPIYTASDFYQLPMGKRNWWWRVNFSASQPDGVFDDLYIRAHHRVAPHTGEVAPNILNGHGYLNVGAANHGPLYTITPHHAHTDSVASMIRKSPNGLRIRRLWIFLQHARGSGAPCIPTTGLEDILNSWGQGQPC